MVGVASGLDVFVEVGSAVVGMGVFVADGSSLGLSVVGVDVCVGAITVGRITVGLKVGEAVGLEAEVELGEVVEIPVEVWEAVTVSVIM